MIKLGDIQWFQQISTKLGFGHKNLLKLPLCGGGANGQEAKQAGHAASQSAVEKVKRASVVTFDEEAKQADEDDQVDAPGQAEKRQKARKKAVQKDDYKVCKNMCCPKSQDFDPCNPCDWAAALLSLTFFLVAFYVIKEVWLYCNIPTVPDLIGHVLTEYVLDWKSIDVNIFYSMVLIPNC